MKPIHKIAGIVLILFLMLMANVPLLPVQLVPESQAFFGRGAAFVVGASVGAASSSAHASAAASQQQAAAAQQQASAAQQQAAAAQQQAAIEKEKASVAQQQAAASGKLLPLGTVVSALPPGCVSTPSGGVEYYYCGGNFYRAMFQGNTLVYVTAKP
jgi:multidrug efflux pump subunit AcrA (membrane-fusion protein)